MPQVPGLLKIRCLCDLGSPPPPLESCSLPTSAPHSPATKRAEQASRAAAVSGVGAGCGRGPGTRDPHCSLGTLLAFSLLQLESTGPHNSMNSSTVLLGWVPCPPLSPFLISSDFGGQGFCKLNKQKIIFLTSHL